MNPIKYIENNGWLSAIEVMSNYRKTYPNFTHLQEVLKPYVDAYTFITETFVDVDQAKLFVNGWISCDDWSTIDKSEVQRMIDLIKHIQTDI